MVSIRLAAPEDFEFFYQLKCEPSNIFWTGFDKPPEKEHLRAWFADMISRQADRSSRKIYMILDHDSVPHPQMVGYVYLDPVAADSCETSIAVSEQFWGRHYAQTAWSLVEKGAKQMGFRQIIAFIREDNIASIKMHTACGAVMTNDFEMAYIPQLQKEVKMVKFVKEIS